MIFFSFDSVVLGVIFALLRHTLVQIIQGRYILFEGFSEGIILGVGCFLALLYLPLWLFFLLLAWFRVLGFRLHKAAEFEGMDKKRVFEMYISGMLSFMGYFILQHLDCFFRESAGKHGGQKINKTEHGLA